MVCYKCLDSDVPRARYALGYRTCLPCGERVARKETHCIVPMSKSNYYVVTDLKVLTQLNKNASLYTE